MWKVFAAKPSPKHCSERVWPHLKKIKTSKKYLSCTLEIPESSECLQEMYNSKLHCTVSCMTGWKEEKEEKNVRGRYSTGCYWKDLMVLISTIRQHPSPEEVLYGKAIRGQWWARRDNNFVLHWKETDQKILNKSSKDNQLIQYLSLLKSSINLKICFFLAFLLFRTIEPCYFLHVKSKGREKRVE